MLVMYPQSRLNYHENIFDIEIEYYFWLKDKLGQYEQMKMEW